MKFVVVLAIFLFLAKLHDSEKDGNAPGSGSTRKSIEQIALTMGIRLAGRSKITR
jgi:hypothetical protein